jgi:drug/metabolite transporter (DMT)-like permease
MSMASRQRALVDWALLIIPGLIWGASFLFIAEGLDATAPTGVTFFRIAVGFLTLSLVPSARKPIARHDWPAIALLGVTWLAFPLSMFPFAEQHVSSALTGMLNGATPLFVAAFATFLTGHRPDRDTAIGLAVGFTGTILLALPGAGESPSSLFSVLLIVAALISYGFAINLTRSLQERHGALPVIWRALGIAVILTAPLGLPAVIHARWSIRPLLCLVALGALGTGIAYVLLAIATDEWARRARPQRPS